METRRLQSPGSLSLVSVTLIVLLCSACGSGSTRDRRHYLSDQYLPSAAAPADVANTRPSVSPLEADGDMRRQLVTSPSGRSYWLRWRKVSESIGKSGSGRLVDGARLPKKGQGYVHIGKSPFGTDETIAYTRFAIWTVTEQYPGTVPVIVGDISDSDGGHLRGHRSHQSGRDVDIGLYERGNVRMRWFKTLTPETIDLGKTWTLIEALLRTGAVEYIFLDRALQIALHEHAAQRGFDRGELERIFQYPGGSRRALIRHVRGHQNHIHVRFVCPSEDSDCS